MRRSIKFQQTDIFHPSIPKLINFKRLIQIVPINITDKAKAEINKALTIKGIPESYFLRVGLRGGACSATYFIGFDKIEDQDELHEIENLNTKVLIKKPHLMYLMGVELDFEEEGNGYTFNKLSC